MHARVLSLILSLESAHTFRALKKVLFTFGHPMMLESLREEVLAHMAEGAPQRFLCALVEVVQVACLAHSHGELLVASFVRAFQPQLIEDVLVRVIIRYP